MKDQLIEASEFCKHHQVEFAFISSLERSGLVKITTIENTSFLNTGELTEVERLARMHYDLDINLSGIEAILHLLERLETMQKEILILKNKLSIYE